MGGNNLGQLGIGNKRSSMIPTKLIDLEEYRIIKVAAGNHSAALTNKGELFVWGTGVFGEFLLPIEFGKAGSFLAPVTEISIGGSFGLALDTKGNLYSWGSNASGELGMGDFKLRATPTITKGLQGKPVTGVSCGMAHAIALGRNINGTTKTPESYKAIEHESIIEKNRVGKLRNSC
jgi:X-linked retinitis pigmentosa GTPase regulator